MHRQWTGYTMREITREKEKWERECEIKKWKTCYGKNAASKLVFLNTVNSNESE